MVEIVVKWMLDDQDTDSHASPVSPTSPTSVFPHLKRNNLRTTKSRASRPRVHEMWPSSDDEESSASGSAIDSHKRSRMTADERRARHREAQRQFAVRKKHQLDAMKKQLQTLERQHQYLELTRELALLESENKKLRTNYKALDSLQFGEGTQPLQSEKR